MPWTTDSLRPCAAVGKSREKRQQGALEIHPKERSLNPCHVLGSRGESQGRSSEWSPWALAPCHGEHLILEACVSPPAPLQVQPALALTRPLGLTAALGKLQLQPAPPATLAAATSCTVGISGSMFKNLCHPLHLWQLQFLGPSQTTKPSGNRTNTFQ